MKLRGRKQVRYYELYYIIYEMIEELGLKGKIYFSDWGSRDFSNNLELEFIIKEKENTEEWQIESSTYIQLRFPKYCLFKKENCLETYIIDEKKLRNYLKTKLFDMAMRY